MVYSVARRIGPESMALICNLCGNDYRLYIKTAADGAIAVFALAITALTGTLSIEETLSGFGNKTIWLIVIAFYFAGIY